MTFEFGRTYVVRPRGEHKATIVCCMRLVTTDNGSSMSQELERLTLRNIKWIGPTAPTRPVTLYRGFLSNAWFDTGDLSKDLPEDYEGLDASAAHIANLLLTGPAGLKLGICGFGMGRATALYSATCFARGRYGNGNPYPVNLKAIICLSDWIPGFRNLRNKFEGSNEATRRAVYLPIFISHGLSDEKVPHIHGESAYNALKQASFRSLQYKTYEWTGHYTVPRHMFNVLAKETLGFSMRGFY